MLRTIAKLFEGRQDLTPRARKAIKRVLANPKYELIPLKNALDQAKYLPEGSLVSITASPTKGMEPTLDLAADLQQMGFDVQPHLSARSIADWHQLENMLAKLERLAIKKAFVVGGDAKDPGEFFDGLDLLMAMDKIGHGLERIGVACYPEGHVIIPTDALWGTLADKQPHASHMTTQMCFSPKAITDWVADARTRNIDLPVVLGIPGVADRLKLVQIASRIGVGNSVRFLSKNTGLIRRFLTPGGYDPGKLLDGLGPALADNPTIVDLHIYTFNQCETTERWRQDYLASL